MNTIERTIIRELIKRGQAEGWSLHIIDVAEDQCLTTGMSIDEILGQMGAYDDVIVQFVKGNQWGNAHFIFGNGNHGLDVLSDYSINLTFICTHIDISTLLEAVLLTPEQARVVGVLIQAELDDPVHLGSNGGQYLESITRADLEGAYAALDDATNYMLKELQ